jgi:hypothetical protein
VSAEDTARQVELLREELRAFVAAGGARELGLDGRTVTKSELVRGMIAALTKTSAGHSTVEVGRTASGKATFSVSVRTGESPQVATAADAAAEALRLWRELDELLPYVEAAKDA